MTTKFLLFTHFSEKVSVEARTSLCHFTSHGCSQVDKPETSALGMVVVGNRCSRPAGLLDQAIQSGTDPHVHRLQVSVSQFTRYSTDYIYFQSHNSQIGTYPRTQTRTSEAWVTNCPCIPSFFCDGCAYEEKATPTKKEHKRVQAAPQFSKSTQNNVK